MQARTIIAATVARAALVRLRQRDRHQLLSLDARTSIRRRSRTTRRAQGAEERATGSPPRRTSATCTRPSASPSGRRCRSSASPTRSSARTSYTEAIDGYKGFIKAHPGNERVQDGYAAFRIGYSLLQADPDRLLRHAAVVREGSGAGHRRAARADGVRRSVRRQPLRRRGAQAHRRVRAQADRPRALRGATSTSSDNKPYSAIGRLEGIIKDYPASQREPEIMLLLGKTYLKMEKPTEARATFVRSWPTQHPDGFPGGEGEAVYSVHRQAVRRQDVPVDGRAARGDMDERLRNLMHLAREHYENREYDRGRAAPAADRARAPGLRRHVQHARRHPPRPGALLAGAGDVRAGAARSTPTTPRRRSTSPSPTTTSASIARPRTSTRAPSRARGRSRGSSIRSPRARSPTCTRASPTPTPASA